MLRSNVSAWLPLALSAAWLASCGANVDGYHLTSGTGSTLGSSSGGITGTSGVGGNVAGGRGPNGGKSGGDVGGSPGGSPSAGGGGVSSGGNGGGMGGRGTGGAGTGGAGTGGAGGTWPGEPLEVRLNDTLSGVTAAAFQPGTRQFFLLMPAAHQYVAVDTAGNVGARVNLPTGTIAPGVFGVSTAHVFFVVGTTLYRQPITGGAPLTVALPGNPLSTALTGAYAGGWFFIGDALGASQALADSLGTLDGNATKLEQIHLVTTDGSGFAFRSLGAGNSTELHRILPGTFALNGTGCNTGLFSLASDEPVGVYQNNVAWVVKSPSSTPYKLNVAPTNAGVCGVPLIAYFGSSGQGSQAVGLIDATHALVVPVSAFGSATIDIKQAGTTLSRTPLPIANTGGAGTPTSFVVGVEAVTHFAVLVTKDIPVLVSF